EKKKQKIWFMAKKFKNTDFDKLIKEFKIKNKMEREKNYENGKQINTSNNIKNAIVLMKTLIKKQKYEKKIKK
ncbi:plasmid maintenance protein, partial [Borreliella burgdorferi]